MPFATSALSVVSPSIDTDAHVFASRRSSSRTCSIGCGGVDSPAACFACRTCNAVSATSFRCASPGNRSRSAEAHDNATRRAPRAVSDRSTGTSTRRSGSRSEFDTTRHGHAALVTTASAVPPRTRTAVRAPRCGPNTMTSARSLSARDPMADAGSPSRMCSRESSSCFPARPNIAFIAALGAVNRGSALSTRSRVDATNTACSDAPAASASRDAANTGGAGTSSGSVAIKMFLRFRRRMRATVAKRCPVAGVRYSFSAVHKVVATGDERRLVRHELWRRATLQSRRPACS